MNTDNNHFIKINHLSFNRIKSIDIFRGLCMSWMIVGHLMEWWFKYEHHKIQDILARIFEPLGAYGFLFISGISVMISYKKRTLNLNNPDDSNRRMVRNTYLIRAFFIFLIAIVYNLLTAIRVSDFSVIWTWYILLTIAISLFLAWPLLKTSKLIRFLMVIIIIIFNELILSILLPHKGNSNIYGILYYFLYNEFQYNPILTSFPFFLFGTIIGDLIFEPVYKKDESINIDVFKRKFLIPSLICGFSFILFSIIFAFPQFLKRSSLAWIIYALGVETILFSILLSFEEFKIIRTKKSYKFLFYFSYYSFTIYLAHNLLYFLFFQRLNIFNIWYFILGTYLAIGLILRAIYKNWGDYASLKIQIGKLSLNLANKIEQRIKK